jgi:hypothetical protein
MSVPAPPLLEVTAADVSVFLRARTQDSEGREVGRFNEDTRPTLMQVEETIAHAHAFVALRVGWSSPAGCLEGYRSTVALAAACIIEKSYFPEQVESRRSAYEELNAELVEPLRNLERCIMDGGLGPGEVTGSGSGDVYSICTPVEHCGGKPLFVPANWNDPYAHNIDDPHETNDAAVQWLKGKQSTWAGEVDADGNPIVPPSHMVDTRIKRPAEPPTPKGN